jgi:CubicO group peptidase (beta-lactamase class C family)
VDTPIAGHCRPELDAVRRAFAANFAERGEVGAAVCVIVGGEVVVDLSGGWADEARTRPWACDTLVDVYSAGKAVVSTLALRLVDDDSVTLDTVRYEGPEDDALMNALAHFNPPGYSSIGVVNTTRWREAQVPSTNGHGSARGLARFYAALLEPGRLLSPDLLELASRPHSVGPCPVLGEEVAFGLGFTPTTPRRPLGPNPRSFGHFGTGGALGFADPDAGVAFGYVMNHVVPRWQSSRNRALVDALYASL